MPPLQSSRQGQQYSPIITDPTYTEHTTARVIRQFLDTKRWNSCGDMLFRHPAYSKQNRLVGGMHHPHGAMSNFSLHTSVRAISFHIQAAGMKKHQVTARIFRVMYFVESTAPSVFCAKEPASLRRDLMRQPLRVATTALIGVHLDGHLAMFRLSLPPNPPSVSHDIHMDKEQRNRGNP